MNVNTVDMEGSSEHVDTKQKYSKNKRRKKIVWNRNKKNKLKSEVASIQSLKQAYNNVRWRCQDLTYTSF
jgi:hypothetical protein